MPNPINNVTLSGSDFADAATIEAVWGGNGGAFQVKDASVFYVLQYPDPSSGNNRSGFGSAVYTEEREIDPGTGTIPAGVTGIRFRNSNAATPATVSATIAPPNQPVLSLGAPGVVGTSVTSSDLRGSFDSTGAIVSGSDFTVNHSGAGTYIVTFSPALANVPTTIVATVGQQAAALVSVSAGWTATTAQFNTRVSSTGVATDEAVNFVAFL